MTEAAHYPNRFGLAAISTAPWGVMKERVDPKFVQFADGETVEGILVSIEAIEVKGKRVARYTVRDPESRELTSFLGTFMINAKLTRDDIGCRISVRCEGEDPNVQRNGNSMKLFKVLVSEKKMLNVSSSPIVDPGITDDDIPF